MKRIYSLIAILLVLSINLLTAQVQIEFPVVEPNDDMEEYLPGGVNPAGALDANSSDLELGAEAFDGMSTPQLVGIRFQNVALESDAEILGAYIQFTADEVSADEPASFIIRAQMDANPAGFDGADMGNISNRPTFNTTVTWDAPSWPFVGAAGEDQRTADLTDLLREVLSQDGWTPGNAIVFTIEGTGTRTAESYNGSSDDAAVLVVSVPEPTSMGLIGCEDTVVPEGNREFELDVIGTYHTGIFDGGAAEIVSHVPTAQRLFFTNADANTVGVLDISNPNNPTLFAEVDMSPYGAGVNSLVYYPSSDLIAVSVEAEAIDGNGQVVYLSTDGTFLDQIEVGVLPDMITVSPDGQFVLTANEGEPSDDYMTDPLGSVSIINTSGEATTIDFTAFNDQRESLINEGIRIFGPGATVAQDLEPEYIGFADDSIAYVVMQENNAFAVVNVRTAEILDLLPLGYKNHNSGQPILNEYRLNELIDMPELGTPTFGGGQPPVFLGGFSGLYFDPTESTDEEYVFYAIPDRGPNDGAVNRNNTTPAASTNLRPFKLPDYQGRIAKFTLNITNGEATLDNQIFLTRPDGTTPISGRGNIPGFDETPVVPADPGLNGTGDIFSDDFQDTEIELGNFTVFSVTSDADWEYDSFGDDSFAEANGFGANEASDDWLITPELDLSGTAEAYLAFFTAKNFDGGDFQVLISTNFSDLASPTMATWDDLTTEAILSTGGFENTFSGDIDISAYTGGTAHIAFRYISTGTGGGDGALWQVDDVNVSATPLSSGDFVDNEGNLYNLLDFDEFGGDFESILRDPSGDFWMCDEYRPAIYHFGSDGVLINRFVPEGTSLLGSTPQPVGTYGTETLPAVYADRRANRGFEGMALNTDDGYLYAFIQSPIENPDNSVRNNSDVIRVLAVDPATGMPVAEYVYLLEANANRGYDIGRVDKIGDVVYKGNGKFLVLERDSSVPGQDEGKKYIFEITLTGATNILGTDISTADGSTDMTLEQMTADEIVAAGVQPIHKVKVLNLPSIGYLPSDKPEGIAYLPNGAIAVLNDNDFGLAGAGVSDNSTLGIIEFCEDNGLDASNRDDAINIQNYPTLGMFQPDAIAGYTRDGAAYIVTANEGDARDYDGFSEEVRVSDLTLDPVAYPNATELQANENLGRLRCTDQLGDYDGDGDIDQIYSYGARSFSIFDRYGNLVYDSGNEFERILAEELPNDFNSNNDENDSFDSRSDDKGPEPEAVEIVERNDTVYALIGLERVGGIMVYNITDPRNPYFVNYVNNRNFGVDAQLPDDSSNPEAGDLGVEDIIYIDAADSPNGSPIVVTANEVSGTISLFGVEFDRPGYFLRIVHNNDGESKVVADTLPDTRPFGGADRFVTIVDDLRASGPDAITLSSGDNFLPGPTFNASLNRAEGLPLYDSEVLNEIGYDALAIGNHDFDFGPDILQRVIEETASTDPEFVSANLDFSAEPGLQALANSGRIATRTIIERGEERIGVVGLTTPSLPTVSSPRNVTVDADLVNLAQAEVDALTSEGVNKIVLVSHLQSINEELDLAGQLTNVDVIIAGGGDELLTNDPATNEIGGLTTFGSYPLAATDAAGKTTYVVTTPGEYRYVGNLVVEFDEVGEVISIGEESDLIPVVGDIASDPEVEAVVDSILVYNENLASNIVARTEVDLDGLRANIRTQETNQGNLIADAFLWLAERESDNFGLDASIPVVAVQNGGGIRNDEVIPAFSDISELKTFDILPFSNFVTIINPISPDVFKEVLENAVSQVENTSGRFLQIAGFEIIYDTMGVADEGRIYDVELADGTKIVENYAVVPGAPNVYVVTNSFTAGGGDGYAEFANAGILANIGPSYQRALFEYLIAEDGVNGVVTAEQYPAGGEGRIRHLLDVGYSLRILHNNDGESKIVADTLPDMRPFGGADRFVTIVEGLRATGPDAITLSSGDNFLPGPTFNASLNRAEGLPLYDSEVLNEIGYDALAIGNHDFDFGPDILQRVIEETASTDPEFVSANLDFSAEPGLQALVNSGRIATRTIIERGEERIGVVGLTTPSLPTISSPRNVVVDADLVNLAQEEVDALIGEGVNKIILVSHLQSINEELELAGQLTDVDVIIAGGGDELLTNDPATNELGGLTTFGSYPLEATDAAGSTTYVVTTPGEYRYVGNLVVEFNRDGEVIRIDDESDLIPVVGDINSDPEVGAVVDSILLYNENLASNIVARTEVDLDGLRANIRTQETNQGNLIADAFLWLAEREADNFGLDASIPVVAVQNGGGIRNDEVIPAFSDISELKTFDILPFSNFVTIVNPIGPDVFKQVLENAVSQVENTSGRFLQIAGFKIIYDTLGVADEGRIYEVELADGTRIVENYTVVPGAPDVYVVTNSFTAAGGDDYQEFDDAGVFANIGPSYQRALFEYLLAEDGVNGLVTAAQYPAGGEGRIRHLIDVSTDDVLDLGDYNWILGPNPFLEGFNVLFDLPTTEDVTIRLYDINGRFLREVYNQRQVTGTQSVAIRMEDMAAGVYMVQVQIGESLATEKVVKLR